MLPAPVAARKTPCKGKVPANGHRTCSLPLLRASSLFLRSLHFLFPSCCLSQLLPAPQASDSATPQPSIFPGSFLKAEDTQGSLMHCDQSRWGGRVRWEEMGRWTLDRDLEGLASGQRGRPVQLSLVGRRCMLQIPKDSLKEGAFWDGP